MSQKVIWIVNEYNGPNAGPETRQIILSRHLRNRGYEVYIISGSTDYKGGPNAMTGPEKLQRVEYDGAVFYVIKTADYHRYYQRVLVALQFQARVWKHRKEIPAPDVIISDFAGLFGNVFLRWKKKYNTRVIFEIMDLWPELFVDMGHLSRKSPIAKLLYALEHKAYREADSIIFSFQGGRDYIIDKGWGKEVAGDVDTTNIGYLNNGVNLEVLDSQRDTYVLEDVDLDSDRFKVIYLGSISEFNGLDVLLETAAKLQDKQCDNISILVYGYGNQEERLRKKAEELCLKNLKFKGRLDKCYAMNVLSRGDLTVFTFKDTPLLKYGVSPNKLFMYFASGKPVLSMIQPAYDLVEEKKCGISVKNDPETVAQAMLSFADMDREVYETYCRNARKTAEAYDYKELINVLIQHIEG